MRQLFLLFLLCFIPHVTQAYECATTYPDPDQTLSLSFDFDAMLPAGFTKPDRVRGRKLRFEEGEVILDFKNYLNPEFSIGIGVGYRDTHIKWNESVAPKHTKFQNALFILTSTIENYNRWDWDFEGSAQMNIKNFQGRYVYYNVKAHGRYGYVDHVGLHIGALYYTGFHYTRVYPIFGFDYSFSKDVKLSLVYPTDMYLRWFFHKDFAVEAAVRQIFSRQRMNENERIKRGLITYKNYGAQIGIVSDLTDRFSADIHVGRTFKGRMRVSTRHDAKREHYLLTPTYYWGLHCSYAF